jgi:cyclin H
MQLVASMKKILTNTNDIFQEEQRERTFLSAADERLLLRQYELQLRDFCRRFNPPMPRSVSGTAFHYFKRFYLHNSVMDYHPKEIL